MKQNPYWFMEKWGLKEPTPIETILERLESIENRLKTIEEKLQTL